MRPGLLVTQFSTGEYPHVAGTWSRFFPRRARVFQREVLAAGAVFLTDAEQGMLPGLVVGGDGWGYSPAQVARQIIRDRRGRRYPPELVARRWAEVQPPWVADLAFEESAVLLDLRRAYESILRCFGVRACSPMRYFSKTPAWEVPTATWWGPGEKQVIRVLPTCGLPGKIRVWESPDRCRVYPRPALDPRPWGTVVTVLHALAARARELGAIYWNTDGGIFPTPASASTFAELCTSLGLGVREVARGPALILGRGCYAVGSKVTIPYRQAGVGRRESDGLDDFRRWASRVVHLDY